MAGAGYKLFATGDVLTAAQVNTYLNEQTVMVFADSAARTTALSGVLAEGMMSYLQDTNAVEVYNGSAWVGVGGGMTNPMTTTGDVIYSSSGSTPARLGIGTAGQVLKVNSGATAPEWGAAAAPSFVGAIAHKTSDQTINATTYTLVTLEAEDIDTDSFHSTVTNTSRMTIPSGKGGKYLIAASLQMNPSADVFSTLQIYKNGTTVWSDITESGAIAGTQTIPFSIIMDLVATDYIEIRAWQGSATSKTIYGTASGNGRCTFLSVTYLGA